MITFDSLYPQSFYESVINKAIAEEIKDFSPVELHRIFDGCVSLKKCYAAFSCLIYKGLTISDLYDQQPTLF